MKEFIEKFLIPVFAWCFVVIVIMVLCVIYKPKETDYKTIKVYLELCHKLESVSYQGNGQYSYVTRYMREYDEPETHVMETTDGYTIIFVEFCEHYEDGMDDFRLEGTEIIEEKGE